MVSSLLSGGEELYGGVSAAMDGGQAGVQGRREGRVLHSHWSRNVEAWLSLVESVATPALLCIRNK